MDARSRLTHNLVAESKAYGYTLTIWGAGALLITTFGVPSVLDVFSYVTGALVGFGSLAALAFDRLFANVDPHRGRHLVAASTVHVAATLGNLLVSLLLIEGVSAVGVLPAVGFALVGFQATVTYNLMLLFEDAVSEFLRNVVPVGESETDERPG